MTTVLAAEYDHFQQAVGSFHFDNAAQFNQGLPVIRPLLPQHHRFDDVPLNERKEYDRPGGARLAFVFTINVNSLMYGYAPQITDKIRRRSEKIVGHGRSNAENHPWHVRSRRHVPDGLADGRSTYLDAQIITHRKQDASEFCVLTE